MVVQIIESWANTVGNVNSNEDIMAWLEEVGQKTYVNIRECSLNDGSFWFYDDYNGEVLNRKRSFFSIKGIRRFDDDHFVDEQPIIFQPEIGYLGIICKTIDGVLNFLMQAKIEPGNVNYVQISPTLQATKSNFTRAHGGKLPAYFEIFENARKHNIIVDQIQSEQGTRFYQKRNRNMIIEIKEDITIYENYKWMTLGQIKKLMEIDNLVNMDTRTVISGIPLLSAGLSNDELKSIEKFFPEELFRSIFCSEKYNFSELYYAINNYKMLKDTKIIPIPLNQLVDWEIDEYGIVCKNHADFAVHYYDINIQGREVRTWQQPLLKAMGSAIYALIMTKHCGVYKFLVRIMPEIGCFDKVEIGPSVQIEASHNQLEANEIEKLLLSNLTDSTKIVLDAILSEEGGRFYHEQNRNIILEIDENEIEKLPEGYFWVEYSMLNFLIQINNVLNIQLRNLLSLLKIQ